MPDMPGAEYLLERLFWGGPVKKDGPLEEMDVEARGRLLGIEWEPWEAEALLRMSQGYFGEMQTASKWDAPPPWPDAVRMWQWVRNQRAERTWDRLEQEKTRNGDCQ